MSDEIRYVPTPDGTQIAHRVVGEAGALDLVVVSSAFFSFEMLAEDRVTSRFLNALSAMGRVVVFDKRGVGSSDPVSDWGRSIQDQWAEDLIAVTEAAELVDPVVISWEPMGVARLAVSRRPDMFSKMVLINPVPRTKELLNEIFGTNQDTFETRSVEERAFPSRIKDPDFLEWLVRAGRVGASPSMAPRIWKQLLSYDKPLTPRGISVPTLILHNVDSMVRPKYVYAVSADLESAEVVPVPGADASPISGDIDPLLVEIAHFVERDTHLASQRRVGAILFTDLVASTERAVHEGDRSWKAILEHHDTIVRRSIAQRDGTVVKFTGDGALCLLPSATAALDAALELRSALAAIDLSIRCGIHVGDIDERASDISGIAVNVAARVMTLAPDGQIMLTTSAAESAAGSPHHLDPAGRHILKGVAGEWQLHQLRSGPSKQAQQN